MSLISGVNDVFLGADNVFTGKNTFNDDVTIKEVKKLFFDGGGDTYITEAVANQIGFFAGGDQRWFINNSGAGQIAGQKLFLDSGGDTYIEETSADLVSFYVGSTIGLQIGNAKIAFYGTSAIVKQTGVGVNATAIHAALVNLGLIAA